MSLMNLNHRLYDPRTGRFISPDPLLFDVNWGQSYNRYAYALNNPMAFVDPSGLQAQDDGPPDPGCGDCGESPPEQVQGATLFPPEFIWSPPPSSEALATPPSVDPILEDPRRPGSTTIIQSVDREDPRTPGAVTMLANFYSEGTGRGPSVGSSGDRGSKPDLPPLLSPSSARALDSASDENSLVDMALSFLHNAGAALSLPIRFIPLPTSEWVPVSRYRVLPGFFDTYYFHSERLHLLDSSLRGLNVLGYVTLATGTTMSFIQLGDAASKGDGAGAFKAGATTVVGFGAFQMGGWQGLAASGLWFGLSHAPGLDNAVKLSYTHPVESRLVLQMLFPSFASLFR